MEMFSDEFREMAKIYFSGNPNNKIITNQTKQLPKASDLLYIKKIPNGDALIQNKAKTPSLTNPQAHYLIALWDKALELEQENERLKSFLLELSKNINDMPDLDLYAFLKKFVTQIEQALKQTEK